MTAPARDDLLVHAYLDCELDPAHALELESAIAADPALAAERDRVEALRDLIRERLSREASPAGLAHRIESAVGLRRERLRPSWGMLAAAAVLAAVIASGATWFTFRLPPTDVSSSDRHTVKPWFSGRVPQAPRVVDLTNEGFPLVGARVDVIGRLPVPTLVYRHRQHLISLTAVPATEINAPARRTIAGYNVLDWSDNGVRYWVVSDLSAGDLDSFAKAFRQSEPDR